MQAVLEALPHEFQQFREVVESFSKLVLQSRLFPGRHPSVERALASAYMHIDAALQGKKSVKLVFANGRMCWLNFEFDMTGGHDQAMHLLRESLVRQSIGEIELQSGVTKEEIAAFAALLAGTAAKQPGSVAALTERIEKIRVRHGFRSTETAEPDEPPADPRETERRRGASGEGGKKGGGAMGKVVEGILDKLEKIQSKDGSTARAKIIEVIEREGGATATILLLDSLREYDDYTFTHSVNVAVISAAIARNLGLGEAFVDSVAHAALLHDIGKLYVPRAVIHKAARLLPSEWQMMKRHPIDGERILREEGLDLVSRRVAYEHHMRHDLTGYPTPKEGFEVHKASEIVRIADSYDALTTKRPYRRQINPYEAIKLMERGSGSEFRRDYFLAFMRVLGNIPIGSMLLLDTGETALVIGMSPGSGELPRVRVLTDAAGEDVEGEIVVDLNELDPETNRPKRRIASIIDQVVRDVEIGRYIAS
jgi:putative nucleotidyltransferase with HDIG domain